eukprot:CAMPEP_0194309940 /NCGR_PEP_ID=MMETSP0171-20130528/6914_1 /TAXON_ID=218684 /ORGANISM="Corethron pennatum, Strain L29A3" /LENGTH=54 /DNA_ID=CAMNT_0039063335 /DNA_START=8 /DNA_END=172 /DNA_ORIENTATION=+
MADFFALDKGKIVRKKLYTHVTVLPSQLPCRGRNAIYDLSSAGREKEKKRNSPF